LHRYQNTGLLLEFVIVAGKELEFANNQYLMKIYELEAKINDLDEKEREERSFQNDQLEQNSTRNDIVEIFEPLHSESDLLKSHEAHKKINTVEIKVLKDIILKYHKPTLEDIAPNLLSLRRPPKCHPDYNPSRIKITQRALPYKNADKQEYYTKNIQKWLRQRNNPIKITHFIIENDDPRIGLRGNYGVRATEPISNGEILCEYIGDLMTMEQFDNLYSHPYHWAQAQRYLCGIDDTIIDIDMSDKEKKKTGVMYFSLWLW